MKKLLITCTVGFILYSCGIGEIEPAIVFEQPIKGRKISLRKKIGHSIKIKSKTDTATLNFLFQADTNYITDNKGDTVFKGTVTKRNELFLLNRFKPDGTVLIHAISYDPPLITGLGSEWYQSHLYKRFMDSLNLEHIIIKSDTNKVHTVGSNKKENKAIFRMIMDSIPADTIIKTIKS